MRSLYDCLRSYNFVPSRAVRVAIDIVNARRERLRELIRVDGFLPVAEICRRLEISEATARRDLAVIAGEGHITRTRGGALADYNASFESLAQRTQRARRPKEKIAVAALALLPPKGTVFLDAGTTILAVARALGRKRGAAAGLTFVTNNLSVATVLGTNEDIDLHVLGGTFLRRQAALLGGDAVRALSNWHFDVALLGGEGMDADGVSNSHPEIAAFQKTVCERTPKTFFCLDATKLGRTTPHRVARWGEFAGLITDAPAKQFAAAGIKIPSRQLLHAS